MKKNEQITDICGDIYIYLAVYL